ncbi:MAG: alpha/beta hydrolase [Chloroflexi bacterium]|nr:alpha/beta hydrolase [Chloroflexota bacterium]
MVSSTAGTDHYVPRADGKVYYRKVGQGEPVLLLQGAGLGGWVWREVVGSLAEHVTCYVLDLPGYDHSDTPPRKYSVQDFAAAILDVMDSVGLDKVSTIGAHTGAIISVDLAISHPQRVRSMVMDGLPYWNKESGRLIFEKVMIPGFTDTTSYDVPVSPLLTWEEANGRDPNLDRQTWEDTHRLQEKSRLWSRHTLEAAMSYDMQEAGPKVNTPTLVLYGDGDAIRRGEERARAAMKGTMFKVVPDCPGHVYEKQPQEFAKLATQFLLKGT